MLQAKSREYHSTAVRQERLGVLQQRKDTFSKNQSAPGVVKNQAKQSTDESKVIQFSHQGFSDPKKVLSIPEEPRQLPKNLIAAFNQVADDDLESTEGKEKEEEDELEEIQPIRSKDCSYYPYIEDKNHAKHGKVENKQSPAPTPGDILQLSQDTNDICTRIQTLEQRLEQTNTHLMNLQTSNKAHILVLEGRLSAVENGRHHRLEEIINSSQKSFLPTKKPPGSPGWDNCFQNRQGQDAFCLKNNKNMTPHGGGGGALLEENRNSDNALHLTNSSLDSHDVLLSLRARLNEAQIVLDEARTTLRLSP
jgi:hypothetical protein